LNFSPFEALHILYALTHQPSGLIVWPFNFYGFLYSSVSLSRGFDEQHQATSTSLKKKPEQKVEKKNKSKDACANSLTWS
jgi:hypothetical protein